NYDPREGILHPSHRNREEPTRPPAPQPHDVRPAAARRERTAEAPMSTTLKCPYCGHQVLVPGRAADCVAVWVCARGGLAFARAFSAPAKDGPPEEAMPTGLVAVVARLREQGAALWLEDGRVRTRAPHGVLTDDVRRELAGQKLELAELLAAEALAQD